MAIFSMMLVLIPCLTHRVCTEQYRQVACCPGVLAGTLSKIEHVACLAVWRGVPVGVYSVAVGHAVHEGGQWWGRERLAADEAVHVGAAKPC